MASTGAGGSDIAQLASLLHDAAVVDTNGVAAACLVAYDIVLTWGAEYELIWKSRASLVKFLYIFIRYFGLVLLLVGSGEATNNKVTYKYCRSFTLYDSIAGQLLIVGVQATLAIRVYALYGRTRIMLATIGGLFIANITTLFTMTGLALQEIVSVPAPFPLSGCFGYNVPGYFIYVWLPSLIFESFLFILTIIQLFKTMRTASTNLSFTVVFFRDGTVYFAVIFVAFLVQSLLYHQKNPVIAQVAVCWLYASLSIAGPRLLLNLRELAQQQTSVGSMSTTWQSTFGPEQDALAFRSPPTRSDALSWGTTVSDVSGTVQSPTDLEMLPRRPSKDSHATGSPVDTDHSWIAAAR